jgi:hypothetical protein
MPAGVLVAALGVIGMGIVATQVSKSEAMIMVIVMALASLHYVVAVKGKRGARSGGR